MMSGLWRNKHTRDVDFFVIAHRASNSDGIKVFGYWINRKNPAIVHGDDLIFITWGKTKNWERVPGPVDFGYISRGQHTEAGLCR